MDKDSIKGPLWLSRGDDEFERDISPPGPRLTLVFLAHRAPGSSHKSPERQSAISYDCSEEELMASIEREHSR